MSPVISSDVSFNIFKGKLLMEHLVWIIGVSEVKSPQQSIHKQQHGLLNLSSMFSIQGKLTLFGLLQNDIELNNVVINLVMFQKDNSCMVLIPSRTITKTCRMM